LSDSAAYMFSHDCQVPTREIENEALDRPLVARRRNHSHHVIHEALAIAISMKDEHGHWRLELSHGRRRVGNPEDAARDVSFRPPHPSTLHGDQTP
jgi:hypothetical protein